MKILSCIGKFLDQPRLINGLNKSMPIIFVGGTGIVLAKKTNESDTKSKTFIKESATLLGVVGSALLAVKGMRIGGRQIFKGLMETKHELIPNEVIDSFSKTVQDKNIKNTLEKAKTKMLSFSDIKNLLHYTEKNSESKKFMDKFIPLEDIDSKHIFGEIKRLSLIGLIPVLGGIAGGTLGDMLTEKKWKKKFPDKLKEGFYQYFANIFLCNIGAGAALSAVEFLEKKKTIKPSKTTRAAAMIAGILGVGVLGGSAIANLIGQKIINPAFCKNKNHAKIYEERVPDALDISLHVDDMASVGVLSGFKWVEPALPILYSLSGYRAGIGYRNKKGDNKEC